MEKRLIDIQGSGGGSGSVSDGAITASKLDGMLLETINSKASTTQVQQIVTERVLDLGGTTQLTPFTPAALLGSIPIWYKASDSSKVIVDQSNNVTSWTNKGDLVDSLVPISTKPTYSNGKIVLNQSPLINATSFTLPDNWCVCVVLDNLQSTASNFLTGIADIYEIYNLTLEGTLQGTTFPPITSIETNNLSSNQVRAFTLSLIDGVLRVAEVGQVSYFLEGNNMAHNSSNLIIGGYKRSYETFTRFTNANLREVLAFKVDDLDIIRKVEGYLRVEHGVVLPTTHPYGITNPVVEDPIDSSLLVPIIT